jgi:hypothetical protein
MNSAVRPLRVNLADSAISGMRLLCPRHRKVEKATGTTASCQMETLVLGPNVKAAEL